MWWLVVTPRRQVALCPVAHAHAAIDLAAPLLGSTADLADGAAHMQRGPQTPGNGASHGAARMQRPTPSNGAAHEAMELEAAAPPVASRPLSIDDVFRTIGEFGTYQRWHYAKVVSSQLAIAVCTLSMVFTNRPPLWRDLADPTPGSGDLTAVARLSEVPCDGGLSWAYVAPWQSVRSEWGLVCEHEWVSRLLDALFFVGFGLGATFFGKVSDARGRKRTHAVSLSLAAAATLLSAAAPGVASYAVLRCVCGMGVGGVNIVTYVWACEPIGQVSSK